MSRDEAWKKWREWFQSQGWKPLPFQEATWKAMEKGENGLLSVPTGAGKTYAVFGSALVDAMAHPEKKLQVIYITPLRALSRTVEAALRNPTEAISDLKVGARTGDTSSHTRAKQKKEKPNILVTTPESLALLLSYSTAREDFSSLRTVIVDEWHELLSGKRGSLLELCLARLRTFAKPKIWALSATLSNLEEAAEAAVGIGGKATVVTAEIMREVIITSVLPHQVDKFPWAGHLGIRMLHQVAEVLSDRVPTLIFMNTRSQAERWYSSLLELKPEWASRIALHHGSLDRKERERVELGIQTGDLEIVVCTSSLDLGVDLPPVERVMQIGSPKGIARLIQRAGRSAHQPGKPCHIFFVPTHAFELVEVAAARDAIEAKQVEARRPLQKPLDVLTQHLVTCALGGGFEKEELFNEIKTTYGFQDLTLEEMEWALLFVTQGGKVLTAYPGYHKITLVNSRYEVTSPQIARIHRQNIGTITSDSSVVVRFSRGKSLGTVEESYIARLRRGDNFLFAGKLLELVLVRDLVAYVKIGKGSAGVTPRWSGGRLPMSSSLSNAVREKLGQISDHSAKSPEIERIQPIVSTQEKLSQIPKPSECLAEICGTRDGQHLFLFPFEGRLVHEGLAALLAYRMGQRERTTFALAVNDYGIEFLAPRNYPFLKVFDPTLFSLEDLDEEMNEALNLAELARRQFREIARISGLVIQNYASNQKTGRQLQASSSLLYDVFQRYDPNNLLLYQAKREVLEEQFQKARLIDVLERLFHTQFILRETEHPTPLAFPLVAARLGGRLLSTLTLEERITKMTQEWEKELKYPSEKKSWNYFPKGQSTGKAKRLSS